MALVMSSGLALSSASWSGLRCSASKPLPIRLTVVSWPAPNNRMILAVSSSLESLLAVLLGLHQLRDQIVAGGLPPQLEHLLEIHRRHRIAGVALLDLLRRQRHRIEQASAIARTCIKYLAMLLGDSEHVADDGDRQAEREILDQVHLALRDDAVERLVDDLLDARAHVLDPARGEGLHHQPAQAGVVRRILLQHPVAHAAEHRLVHDLGAVAADRALDIILAEPLVAHARGWPRHGGCRHTRRAASDAPDRWCASARNGDRDRE